MKFKDLPYNLQGLFIKAIRDGFKYGELYSMVIKRHRIEKPVYKKDGELSKKKAVWFKCACCNKEFKRGEIEVDHKRPVVRLHETTKNLDIKTYIDRVFCKLENLEVLCKPCHKDKTAKEKKKRKLAKL